MATKKRSAKAAVPTDSNGQPDIYVLRVDQGLTMKAAAEKAGVTFAKAHDLLYRQEVEHNPDLEITGKGAALGKKLSKARAGGVRWERLAARSGLGVAKVKELVAEAEGVEVDDLKRERKPAEKKAKKTPAKRGRKAKADPEPEDVEDEDVEDEDEVEDEDVEDVEEDDVDDEDDEDDEDEDEDEDDEEDVPAPPKKRGRGRPRKS